MYIHFVRQQSTTHSCLQPLGRRAETTYRGPIWISGDMRGSGVVNPWLTLPPYPSTSLLAHTSVLPFHPLRDCIHCLFTTTSPNWEQTGLSQCPDREMRLVPGHLISPSSTIPMETKLCRRRYIGESNKQSKLISTAPTSWDLLKIHHCPFTENVGPTLLTQTLYTLIWSKRTYQV